MTDAGHGLRNASHMLSALRLLRTSENRQLLVLMTQLVRLTDSVASLRDTQNRAAQAAVARLATEQMRAAMRQPRPVPRRGPAVATQAPSMAAPRPVVTRRTAGGTHR